MLLPVTFGMVDHWHVLALWSDQRTCNSWLWYVQYGQGAAAAGNHVPSPARPAVCETGEAGWCSEWLCQASIPCICHNHHSI